MARLEKHVSLSVQQTLPDVQGNMSPPSHCSLGLSVRLQREKQPPTSAESVYITCRAAGGKTRLTARFQTGLRLDVQSCRIMLNLSSKGVERLRFVITPHVWFVSIYLMAKPCNYNQVMQTFFQKALVVKDAAIKRRTSVAE